MNEPFELDARSKAMRMALDSMMLSSYPLLIVNDQRIKNHVDDA